MDASPKKKKRKIITTRSSSIPAKTPRLFFSHHFLPKPTTQRRGAGPTAQISSAPAILSSRPITNVSKDSELDDKTLSNRRPKAGCSIQKSSLRPHVKAGDRVHLWRTPYSDSQRDSVTQEFSAEILQLGRKATLAGLSEATRESYGAGLLRFTQFCDERGIREDLRMPANEYLLIAFIGKHMGKVSGASVKGWLSGLRAWHELNGALWPENSRLLRFARAGSRTAGAHLRRPKRNPISIKHMLALFRALNFSIPLHCAIWAVACMAFWGCRRLGELTVPSVRKFDPTHHVQRSAPITFATFPNGSPKSVSFPIPWTKTTKIDGATVVGTACPEILKLLCPVTAVTLHLHANKLVPPEFSLFAYIDSNGSPRHMVKSKFLDFCQKIWKKFDLPNVQGHSFRIGGAVELLLAGVKPEIVAATGGWTSLAFLIYWRRFEDILPAHILGAYTPDQIARLKRTIDDYQASEKYSDKYINECVNGVDIIDFE